MTRFTTIVASAATAAAVAGVLTIAVGHAATPATSGFVPLTPCRAVDTREGKGGLSTLGEGSTGTAQLSACGVPASATAVFVNATALNASAATFITLWGSGGRPATSTLNPAPGGAPAPNGVIVPANNASLQVFNRFGSVDLILDVSGYFTAGSPSTPGPTVPTGTGTLTIDYYTPNGAGTDFAYTMIGGTFTGSFADSEMVEIRVTCPDGIIETATQYVTDSLPHAWSVMCDGGAWSAGATATWLLS